MAPSINVLAKTLFPFIEFYLKIRQLLLQLKLSCTLMFNGLNCYGNCPLIHSIVKLHHRIYNYSYLKKIWKPVTCRFVAQRKSGQVQRFVMHSMDCYNSSIVSNTSPFFLLVVCSYISSNDLHNVISTSDIFSVFTTTG